jgi:uncharacterized protein YbjQ (UPF0145 family)
MPPELLIALIVPIVLIVVGRIAGSHIERRHLQDIAEREARFVGQPSCSTKRYQSSAHVRSAELAMGSVVVSVDHFKRFVSAFRMLVGGEVRSYSSLIERARREAVLRMKESHPDADAFVNVRLETSTISSSTGDEGAGTVEVLAYGTALHYDPAS